MEIPAKEVLMRVTPYCFAVGVSLLAFCPTSARADLLSEPLSISATVPVLGTVHTSTFTAFNPALGTLVSMSWSLSGTTDYTGGGIPADEGGDLELQPDPPPSVFCGAAYNSCLFFPALGSGLPFSFVSSGVTDTTVLSDYTGTGLRDFGVYDFGGNATDHFALTGDGTVTFDYTPTPEPSRIGLPMLAVIGTIIALRRRSGPAGAR